MEMEARDLGVKRIDPGINVERCNSANSQHLCGPRIEDMLPAEGASMHH